MLQGYLGKAIRTQQFFSNSSSHLHQSTKRPKEPPESGRYGESLLTFCLYRIVHLLPPKVPDFPAACSCSALRMSSIQKGKSDTVDSLAGMSQMEKGQKEVKCSI